MAYEYYLCPVIKIEDETEIVKRFYFQVPKEHPFTFKPGQFVMLNLPIESRFTNRAYSIASPPTEDQVFELAIVLNKKGLGTPYLWENVEVGTQVQVTKRALGKFVLKEPIENDICFIATGTGIAPLRSMLLHILRRNIPHKNLYMVFGNRKKEDILYREEMEQLEKEFPEFKFIPALSREEGWKYPGYVHKYYEELFADKRPASFYICGWADMLKEARHRLTEMGYDKKSVHIESFD